MPADRSELVEIFDLDAGEPTHEPDQISQGRDRPLLVIMDRWPWWRRTHPVTRWLATLGAAVFVVAAVAGYGALAAHPGTQYFVNQQTGPAAPVTVDALGCPAAVTCALVAVPDPIVNAVRGIVASGRITYAEQAVDPRSGRVYRREVDLTATRTTMRIVSACVPGSGAAPAQAMSLTVDTGTGPEARTLTAPAATGRQRLTQVLPGALGCSMSTEADTTLPHSRLGDRSVGELLVRIAAIPTLMVTP